MTTRIVDLPALHLVGLRGLFVPATIPEIPALWGRFIPRLGEIKGRKGSVTYGACRLAPEQKLEYTAAVEVGSAGPAPEGWVAFTLAPRPYAVFTHQGHIRDIGKTWDAIWDRWMKESKLKHLEGAHDFERYDERWNPQTGEGPVDIYIAIEK